eukprot:scaffold1853_cov287-Chaetoceros_neogracile.AAC.26
MMWARGTSEIVLLCFNFSTAMRAFGGVPTSARMPIRMCSSTSEVPPTHWLVVVLSGVAIICLIGSCWLKAWLKTTKTGPYALTAVHE